MTTASNLILSVSVLVAFTAFLGISYRSQTLSMWETQAVNSWSVKRLRGYLQSRGVKMEHFKERGELVEAVKEQMIADRDSDFFTGYTLLLVGYIMFPALGIALIQRIHEQRGTGGGGAHLLEEENLENIIYNPLAHSSLLQTRYFFGRAEIRSLVDAATVIDTGKCGGDSESCIVCLAHMIQGQKMRQLGCGHRFHVQCCDAWLIYRRKNWCPLCMTPVVSQRDGSMNPIVS